MLTFFSDMEEKIHNVFRGENKNSAGNFSGMRSSSVLGHDWRVAFNVWRRGQPAFQWILVEGTWTSQRVRRPCATGWSRDDVTSYQRGARIPQKTRLRRPRNRIKQHLKWARTKEKTNSSNWSIGNYLLKLQLPFYLSLSPTHQVDLHGNGVVHGRGFSRWQHVRFISKPLCKREPSRFWQHRRKCPIDKIRSNVRQRKKERLHNKTNQIKRVWPQGSGEWCGENSRQHAHTWKSTFSQ